MVHIQVFAVSYSVLMRERVFYVAQNKEKGQSSTVALDRK